METNYFWLAYVWFPANDEGITIDTISKKLKSRADNIGGRDRRFKALWNSQYVPGRKEQIAIEKQDHWTAGHDARWMIWGNGKDLWRRSTTFNFSSGFQDRPWLDVKETTRIFRTTRLNSYFGSQETEESVKSARPTAQTGWRTEDSAVPSCKQDLERWRELKRRKATFQAAEAKVLSAAAHNRYVATAYAQVRCGRNGSEQRILEL